MKFVVLGGYGEMGSIIVKDLFYSCKNCEIVVAGRDESKAKRYAKSFKDNMVKGIDIDVNNHKKLVELLKGCDVVINSVQYYLNLKIMRAALEAKVHYVDLGGLFHMTRKQLKMDKMFRKRNLIAVLGCGATPGITNVMAGYGASLLDKVHEIHVKFAGYDYTEYGDLPFIVPYSMYTVFDEFTDKPAFFSKGKLEFVKPVSGIEYENFPKPVGKVGCFHTLHSEIATFPISFKKKGIRECSFKAGFDEDFTNKVKFLVDVGLASKEPIEVDGKKISPRNFAVKILNRFIPSEKIKVNDIEYLRVTLIGKRKGKRTKIILDSLAKSNRKYNLYAGSWDTGVPPSIVAQMIAKGQVTARGALPPEACVNPQIFFKELGKRNIKIHTRINHS